MPGAFVGKGTTLKQASTQIADVVSISGPSVTVGTVETTHLGSAWKEHLPTIPELGEVSMTIEYNPTTATHATLYSTMVNRTVAEYTITFSNAEFSTWTFNAYITGFNVSGIEVEGLVTAELTFKPTGAPTVTSNA